ncbi:FMN-dependent NADH-azoreductase [Marinomonas colpomeniae]|uniref:FMN dependent NADH:quinone oxidoreductase n=1 Tax=Marinomonas colpomeniae TaxID=2774408 RepID=A0ABR8NUB0_9GAMM|nr:NAD(P)H-dependent oxidoreductase [Marinomonas colpomeniae]MBD5769635.1 NAD(P)H-dependent oxidoreductase [Marinomonas colpomeniae]
MKVWHIDSSSRDEQSHSRRITQQFIENLSKKTTVESNPLNVAAGLPFLTDIMIGSYFTPDEQRTTEQKSAISVSNDIVKSAKNADVWVIGVPIYNFSMPASFKAFIDLLCRSKETFTYTETGPIGLLENKKVFVVVTSGGTEIGSDIDFLTPWLKHCLSFIGVQNVHFIHADKYSPEKDNVITQQIEEMTSNLAK